MVLARESENETKKRKKGTCRQKHCSTEIMNIQETILLVYFFWDQGSNKYFIHVGSYLSMYSYVFLLYPTYRWRADPLQDFLHSPSPSPHPEMAFHCMYLFTSTQGATKVLSTIGSSFLMINWAFIPKSMWQKAPERKW